jgi:hypothetical protein
MEMLEVPAEQALYQYREEEASFVRTKLIHELEAVVQQPVDETICPFQIEFDHHLRLNADDINRLITPFEVSTGVAA